MSRYSIGIDLGTTNCAMSFADLEAAESSTQIAPLRQLESLNTIHEGPLLPSFYYFTTQAERGSESALSLFSPDGTFAVGVFARLQSGALGGRVVQSAKSWLGHPTLDREAPILPWGSDEVPQAERLSPVQVSAAYLKHLRRLWDERNAQSDLSFDRQQVVVTVPASFDEAAQQLTMKAIALAGYPATTRLLEEPQAAFYCWLEAHRTRVADALPVLQHRAQQVLVCDVGGGTTDFSLFRIERGQEPVIERVRVSDHILLGGDNIDLAVAHTLERQLTDEQLTRRQWAELLYQARALKERILAAEQEESIHVAVGGEGRHFFAAALSTTIAASTVRALVLDGFFPLCPPDARPQKRSAALRELGLPYAADSAVTRHLAAFLNGEEIDAVLFAGGTMKPRFLRTRLLELLAEWQQREVVELEIDDADLAVARGAAFYGALVARKLRAIKSSYARSIYLEVREGAASQLVCVLPLGTAPGESIRLHAHRFSLLVNQPVRFQAYASSRRRDTAGTVSHLDEDDFFPLPPLQTIVTGEKGSAAVEVEIEAVVNELGMLQLYLTSSLGRTALEFNLRRSESSAAEQPELEIAQSRVLEAFQRITKLYGKKQDLSEKANPRYLVRELEEIFGQKREEWNIALLRRLWEPLHGGITRRGRSAAHEAAWFYLAGFSLRPGYGAELDSWRMAQLWRSYSLGMAFPREGSSQANWWIMWRRVGGGLTREQQQSLFQSACPSVRRLDLANAELVRLLGTLERIESETKTELAERLARYVAEARRPPPPHVFWAIGRLLSRVPLYSGAESVLDPHLVESLFELLAALDWREHKELCTVFSLAGRVTENRALDLEPPLRKRLVAKLEQSRAAAEQLRVVREYEPLSREDEVLLFGESLPLGLGRIKNGDSSYCPQ